MTWKPRILVVGAGFAGIGAAARLLQDGLDDLLIVEQADGIGGVWRDNTYPGAGCDIPSHLYSFSFQQNPHWTRRFAGQGEILQYLHDVVSSHGLNPYLRLRTAVTDACWDATAQCWRVGLRGPDGRSSQREVDVLITATGQLSVPAIPDLPGLDTFAGPVFHSAHWPQDLDLQGRRVAVVGTGASAIQFVPEVARQARHTQVFQRSAPYIVGKNAAPYRTWERQMFQRLPWTLRLSRLQKYLWHEMLGIPFLRLHWLMRGQQEVWRRDMHAQIRDPQLRDLLTPRYRMGCKRILRSTDWYRTLAREDVTVTGSAITAVTPGGLRTADGVDHPAEVLVLGTGFRATRFLTPMRVTGVAGRDLHEVWQDGARAYLGTMISGFPNLFLLYGPGTNLGHNSIIFMIESQLRWVRDALRQLRELDLGVVDVRADVQSRYDAQFTRRSRRTIWESGCESWYTVQGRNVNNWPAATPTFRHRLRRFVLADMHAVARRADPTREAAPLSTAGPAGR